MKKRLRRIENPDLTEFERQYLLMGFCWFDGDQDEVDLESLLEKWDTHRDELMANWFGEGNYFARPWAWWNIDHPHLRRACVKDDVIPAEGTTYSKGIPDRTVNSKKQDSFEDEKDFIVRNRLLNEHETVRFWNEKAQVPGA